ncbi:MAG: CBS domain-containing protein [Chloroflexi bacterium]|nr:CBS domain-containing protein [Chloroflexota bacterium]
MRIILTHEQADFDALASLLGANLLDEAAVPVLPRRLNRNVRAFVTLYGRELPFLDPRDLLKENIESATLVDTQSPITIKGMSSKTRIHVVDHHPARTDIPDEWTITTEDIGATTTLLVEAIQENNGGLSVPHATLLLLGIYEDTGSLTYTRTSPRDAQAVSFLLQQGADLQIAQGFLNHPLSLKQQSLYDEIRTAAQTHTIHGHTIIVACGDAEEVEEELSSIAHKLRDLVDPDALFLLFTTRAGVQLIARSTTDYVDVGKIATHFGGGGHARAAAALIKNKEIATVQAEMLKALPNYIQPAITVAEIMSKKPQLLPPDTPAAKAAQQMQRYGYEGFPVVEKGKVIGLLTRRAVDRAVAHKLNLTAAELMLAGEVTIGPHESLETLQQRMTDTGWGQIPVIESNKKKIIGIVTRTDLLDILTPRPVSSGREKLSVVVEKFLLPARLALLKTVADIAHEQKKALYIVGGFVRDLLLQKPSPDYDLVVEGDAIALANALMEKYGGVLTSHKRFGTAKWQIAEQRKALAKILSKQYGEKFIANDLPETIDLVSARREFYTHPTALPTVERGSIKFDLHRRDFTINTLAIRLDGPHFGELNDHWGGRKDIKNGIVRVLHSLSFIDDPTRILRAVRFEQRFGFQIAPRTLELLQAALPLLNRVSGDRIRHELDNILTGNHSIKILTRLSELEVLSAIHTDLTWNENLEEKLRSFSIDNLDPNWSLYDLDPYLLWPGLAYIIWMINLSTDQAKSVAARLRLRSDLEKATIAAVKLHKDSVALVGASPSVADARLAQAPPLARYAVHLVNTDENFDLILNMYNSQWQHVRANITGHDLRSLGVQPGPEYRHILDAIRAAWLDGEIKTKRDETSMLKKLINE